MQVADQTLHVGVGQATQRGGRADNQDFSACHIGAPRGPLTIGLAAALADGMGGAKGGRVAAELAVRPSSRPAWSYRRLGLAQIAANAVDASNRWINTLGRSDPALNGMACTLSALLLCGRSTHLVHVGDSRIYRLRDGLLTLLTTDHTLGAPGTTHALTRAVGAQDSLRADHFKETVHLHDRYLICSDGVHGSLSHREIHALLAKRAAPTETAQQLVEHVASRTDSDNATAMVLDILALPDAQYADLELAAAERPIRNAPASGEVIDDYELGQMLGDGQYMRVFKAADRQGGRAVVLKFPKSRPGIDALLRASLLREMWIGAHVRSPYSSRNPSSPPMSGAAAFTESCRFMKVRHSNNACARPRIPLGRRTRHRDQTARALAALHRARDHSPGYQTENIILEPDGGLKLIDLGVARLRRFEEPESLEIPGTRSYMAPELFTGSAADESSDLFALGITLFRMFTGGSYPYGEMEPFAQPRFGKQASLAKSRPDLPAWLERCISRAMALEPRERFADAIEFGFELEHGSVRAVPQAVGRLSLYERNPLRFWQCLCALLFVALLVALANQT